MKKLLRDVFKNAVNWVIDKWNNFSIGFTLPRIDPYDRGNPPGYVTLVKIWTQVSRSDVWFRAFSAVAGALTVPMVYAIVPGLQTFGSA